METKESSHTRRRKGGEGAHEKGTTQRDYRDGNTTHSVAAHTAAGSCCLFSLSRYSDVCGEDKGMERERMETQ